MDLDEKTDGIELDIHNLPLGDDGDGYGERVEYLPGVYLSGRIRIPAYEKAAIHFSRYTSWISIGALAVLLGMTFLDVILRTVFNSGVTGAYDYTRYFMILIAVFALPLTTVNDEQVAIDVLASHFPEKAQSVLVWLNFVLVVGYTYLLITQNWKQAAVAKMAGHIDHNVIWPVYPFFYLLAIGFAAMLLVVIVKIVNQGRGVK